MPPFVVDEVIKLDTDTAGEEAFWIWIIVEDAAAKREGFFSETRDLTRRIREQFHNAGEDRWAYVRYRTRSEQDEIEHAWAS